MTTNPGSVKFCFITLAAGAVFVILFAVCCLGKQQPSLEPNPNIPIEKFLRKYLRDPQFGNDKTTQYSVAVVKLDDNPKDEIVVYVSSANWCGSGGCLLLVLQPKGSSYEVIGRTTIVRLPIRVLHTSTNGWRDIGVWVQGGGIQPGYEAALPFNGKKYPSNPSVPPARRLTKEIAGEVLIPEPRRADRPSTPD